MAPATEEFSIQIRKLRKKLRQIENLERSTRELTEEETLKVERKIEIRECLLDLIAEHGDVTQTSEVSRETNLHSFQSSDEYVHQPEEDEENTNSNSVIDENQQSEYRKVAVETTSDSVHESVHVTKPEDVTPKPNFPVSVSQPVLLTSKVVESPTNDTQKSKDTKKVKKEKSSLELERKRWQSSQFVVHLLDGHNDLITDLSTDGKLLVSASRDTTVKVWDLITFEEKRSLGGHSNIVTSVQLLSGEQSNNLCESLEDVPPGDILVISGSLDCSIRIWSVNNGQTVKEIYTFDPITKLCYHGDLQVAFTGSAGGKLAVWNVTSGEVIHSVCAHQESITGIQFCSPYLYSASEDGLVQVHELREGSLFRVFISENVHKADGSGVTLRLIRDIAVRDEKIFYGDDGENLKILDWKAGIVTKLLNNSGEFGSTDSVCCDNNLLLASGYDLDNGLGFINVRCFDHGGEYLSTLTDDDTERIMCLTCYHGLGDRLLIASGGTDLKVWSKVQGPVKDDQSECVVRPKFMSALSGGAVDSDVDSDFESDEDDGVNQQLKTKRLSLGSLGDNNGSKGWTSWCTVL